MLCKICEFPYEKLYAVYINKIFFIKNASFKQEAKLESSPSPNQAAHSSESESRILQAIVVSTKWREVECSVGNVMQGVWLCEKAPASVMSVLTLVGDTCSGRSTMPCTSPTFLLSLHPQPRFLSSLANMCLFWLSRTRSDFN